MKTLKLVVLSLALLLVPSLALGQQFTLTQTSLSGKINNTVTTLTVASATGITVNQNTYNTGLYVDRELMTVIKISGTTVTVIRGAGGTQASSHQASQMVLVGNGNAFINYDPEGTCSTTAPSGPTEAVPAQPTINTRTGNQWLCSSLTGTWVPGFGNPGVSGTPIANTAVVASVAGTTTPSGPLFHISGTNAITAWGIPIGCNATVRGGCTFTVIPDAAFTTTATNNIATAVTAVANLAMIWTWDATNSKFVVLQSK